jgi:hypothetical protein
MAAGHGVDDNAITGLEIGDIAPDRENAPGSLMA